MKTVFADADYWVAAVHPREDLHDKALQVSSSLGPHLIAFMLNFSPMLVRFTVQA